MYLFRLLGVFFAVLLARGRRGLLEADELPMRVWPNDLDPNLHLNNGRFLTLMDLGRFHQMGRAGLVHEGIRRGWRPIVGAATIRFRASLAPFQRFTLRTRVLCFDEKWFYIEQRFLLGHRSAAVGLVKALLRGKEGNVPTAQVLAAIGETGGSPPMPAFVQKWIESEEEWAVAPEAKVEKALGAGAAAVGLCMLVATLGACAGPKAAQAPVQASEAAAIAAARDQTHEDAQRLAALAAGRARDRAALPVLTDEVANDAAARALADTAAWALGRIDGGESALIKSLTRSGPASAAAARALGSAKASPAALAALVAALASPSGEVAGAAALSLGIVARTGAKGRDAEVAALAAGALLSALARPELAVKRGAAYALGRLPKLSAAQQGLLASALPPLLDDHADAELRALAARAWGKQGLAAQGLSASLADPDWRVRVEAARALATAQGGAEAITIWLPAFERLAGAEGTFAEARWAHPLVALLESATAAKVGLAALPQPMNLAAATPAATVAVRCAAALARDKALHAVLDTPACGQGLEAGWASRARTGALAAELLTALPAALKDKGPALHALALAGLSDADGRVRARTAASAGPELLPRLIELLADADPFVVATAAGQLAAEPEQAKSARAAAVAAVVRLATAHASPTGDPLADALAGAVSVIAAGEPAQAQTSAPPAAASPAAASPPSTPAPATSPATSPAISPARDLLRSLLPAASIALHDALADALPKLGDTAPLPPAPKAPIPDAAKAGLAPSSRPQRLRIVTNLGEMVVRLRSAPDEAPLTSAALVALARQRFYDGLTWHRVVPDFVIQGGDPRGDGDGGPGFALPDEHTPLFFERGTLGIATSGPDTGGSQLFLCHSAQPHLDGRYTIAGELESGEAVLDAIQVGDEIRSVTVE